MKFKQSSNHFRYRSALLVLLLLFAFIPFSLSGCGSGGGSGSSGTSSGASVSPNSGGGVNLSQNYTISGTVTGGSSNIPTGTVTLYILNSSNNGFTSTGYTGTINNGSYTISYPGTGLEYFMVMVTTPSGNTMYNIALGSFGIPNVTMNIDELTTAQAVYVFIQNGGTMSASSPGSLPFGSMGNYAGMYNSIPSSLSNTTNTGGFSYNSVYVNNNATVTNEIEEVAAALASCVQQQTSYCSSITGNIPNYTASTGVFVYDLMANNGADMQTASMQAALSNLITNVAALSLPWPAPTASSSSTTPTTNTFSVGTDPAVIAVDENGNVWVAGNYNGGTMQEIPAGSTSATTLPTPITIEAYNVWGMAIDISDNIWIAGESLSTGDPMILEIPAGSTSATTLPTPITVDNYPFAITVDGSDNIWIGEESTSGIYSGFIQEIPAGSTGATHPIGVGNSPGFNIHTIAIDGSGNVWVANEGSNNVTELNSSGTILETYTVGTDPWAIAIDASGDVWVANMYSDSVTELNSSGTTIGTFTVGSSPDGIAIDGSGNVWVANEGGNNVTELNSSGTTIGTFIAGSSPDAIAIDGSGNVWVANLGSDTVTELKGAAAGVKTPLVNQPK